MDNNFDKNQKLGKDLNVADEVSIKTKIFNFYFFVLRKKDINMFFCSLLLILETLQLISFTFSEPHLKNWKIKESKMKNIKLVVGAARITSILTYIDFDLYIIIFFCLLVYIFAHSLFLTMLIKFNKTTSKFYQIGIIFTRYFTTPLTIFLIIPINEMILLPLKCENKYVDVVKKPIKCWNGLHYLYACLSVIFTFAFYCLIIISTMFYFNPFNSKKATTKINTSSDSFLYFTKAIMVLKYIFIKDEYISIVIMLVLSLFNLKKGFDEPTYNNYSLECFLSIRNASFFWTNFVLIVNKLAEDSKINGTIYLLIFGYPLIVFFSIIYYRKKSESFVYASSNFNNINEYLTRTKYLIKLIDNYIDSNSKTGGKPNKSNTGTKNEILLKGVIQIHEETCLNEECPLKKFLENPNNFTIQKTSLLHYINNHFSLGIKKFPNSRLLLMIFVQFNYEKKYNLNAAKTYLAKLEKQKNSLSEDYVIHCIKQNIQSVNKLNDMNDGNEMIKVEDTIEQKYQRLKFLVETSTKLYGEFWGILAANLTNNLNLNKLFVLGNKLNKFLNEINSLWENDLKNKKIDLENQSVAQLYAYFLREILRNKKRSEEITKKLNEEQHYESRKVDDEKFDINNLDILLENQDYVIFCRTNEKGECSIIQCSNSIIYLLGFIKQDLIGKNIEVLMPSIYIEEHAKMLSNRLKLMHSQISSHKENYRSSDKKQVFLLPKTKIGYLIPLNARFTIYNDDDFSNTYIIKSKFDAKDTKTVYAFYVLTKDDFSVDSISSSAINLGLSMDLLKKYVININILIRNENNTESISLGERYTEFEEEPRKVTWVFPDIIYPKNDSQRAKDDDINELIKESTTKVYFLLISRMKYNDEETLGYCFRFTECDNKKGNVDPNEFKPNSTKHILFDVLRLNYIRTILVTEKSDDNKLIETNILYNNDTNQENEGGADDKSSVNKNEKKKKNKGEDEDEESNDEEKKKENQLTKEKILEFNTRKSEDVKNFILSLPFYGNEISLEKHRPNKERYPVGKGQEPIIKISISSFIKRIEEKLKAHPDLRRKMETKNSDNTNPETNTLNSQPSNSISPNLSLTASDNSSTSSFANEFSTDSSAALSNIFNEKSVTYITFFSLIIFIIICVVISIEFAISLTTISDSQQRMSYMDKAFTILNTLVYTKFFITEAILSQNTSNYLSKEEDVSVEDYVKEMMTEMASCRAQFSETYSYYSNATVTFSTEYNNYISNTQVYIMTLSNGEKTIEHQPFSIAMSRIPTSIYYVSRVTDYYENININDRNAYELMMNLLNDYLLVWRNVTVLLVDDVKTHAKMSKLILFFFIFSFFTSILSLLVLWKLITKFIDDREKPIDLFLTIKKKKFEELKNSSESFVNKLLNKFFGNEENEEESMVDYSSNMKPDDINIIKFKTKNEYKQSLKSASEYLINYIKIVIFFIVIQGYMIFKYTYNTNNMKSINKFTDVFNVTQYCQSDNILSLDIIKSFLYDPLIPIYNQSETEDIFKYTFLSISDTFENLFIVSYNTSCFLHGNYIKKLYDYLNKDITSIATNVDVPTSSASVQTYDSSNYLGTLENGFKSVIARYFELIRYICVIYINPNTRVKELWNSPEFKEINSIAKNVIRPWYKTVVALMNKEFEDFISQIKLVNVSTFIVLICSVILLYCLVWKSYEENLKQLLKTSVDLINLIPEEIKYQIVQKLNEEENKNE